MAKAKAKSEVKKPRASLGQRAKPASSSGKRGTNWVGVELAYTTTSRTLDDIGGEFDVSAGRISQKAKEMGWKRGALADRVRAQAAAKVAALEAHDAQVEAGTEGAVEASAVLMANTILRERRDVGRLIRVAGTLLGNLETGIVAAKTEGAKAKAGDLGEQIDNLRKLGNTMTGLITLERSVLGITDSTPLDPTKRVEEAIESGMDKLRERFKAKGVAV